LDIYLERFNIEFYAFANFIVSILTYFLYQGGSIQTIFSIEDERMLLEAAQLAKEARSSRQFTDVQKFTLICIDCKIMLNGQAAAQQHAKDTGHKNFGEVAA